MEPSKPEQPSPSAPSGKPAPSRWGQVLTGLFVVLMGARMVLTYMKSKEPTPAEILARLPRVEVPPPEPIRIDIPPPPVIKIPELKPMSSAPIMAPTTPSAAPAKPEAASEPAIDGVAELKALQGGGEKARAAAKRLLDHPEAGDVSLPFLLLSSELVGGKKAYQAILHVLTEERRTDRVTLVAHAIKEGGEDTRKPLVDLLVSWGTPEAAAALERLSKEHHRPEARAMASEALAGLKH